MVAFIMALALSSGFSIYLQDTYLGTLKPVVQDQFEPFYPGPLKKYRSFFVSALGMAQLMFFVSSTVGTAAALAAGPVFAGQLNLIKREVSSGSSIIAYAAGRITFDLVIVILIGFVFVGTWMLFGHSGRFYNWMATILSTTFASSGIGYIFGASAKRNNVAVYSILLTFICSVFAGVEPTLRRVNQLPIVNWPWYLSFGTYAAEATLYTWSEYHDDAGAIDGQRQSGADEFGYQIKHGFGRSIGALFALGISMRIVTVFLLWRKVRK